MQTCSICSAPREVRDAVNDAHEKGSTLREIQKISGGTLSRASLSRHFRNCLNKVRIVQHGSFASGRLLRKNPSGGFCDQNTWQHVLDSQVKDNDVELVIEYAAPVDLVARAAEVAAVKAKAEAALQPAEIPAEPAPN